MTLHVIGAGFGRTGTYSLKLALDRLGVGPTHHMEEVIHNPPHHVPMWQDAIDGQPDWSRLYAGYGSAVDWPTASFWEPLARLYPDARVVLTVRSAASWADSFGATIDRLLQSAGSAPPHMAPLMRMVTGVVGLAGVRPGMSQEEMIATYEAHIERLRSALPAGRLLVYDVRQGWEPLCNFLGLPVPGEPFPVSNNREDFWARVGKAPQ